MKWDEDIAPVVCGYLLILLMLVCSFGTMLAVHDFRARHGIVAVEVLK